MGGTPNLRQHQRPMMLFTFTLAAKAAYHHFHRKCKAGSIGITQKKKNNLPTAEDAHPMTAQTWYQSKCFDKFVLASQAGLCLMLELLLCPEHSLRAKEQHSVPFWDLHLCWQQFSACLAALDWSYSHTCCLSSSLMPWVSRHPAELNARCANANY